MKKILSTVLVVFMISILASLTLVTIFSPVNVYGDPRCVAACCVEGEGEDPRSHCNSDEKGCVCECSCYACTCYVPEV